LGLHLKVMRDTPSKSLASQLHFTD